MSNTVTAKYQGRDTSIRLPEDWSLAGIGNPAPVEPLTDVGAAVTAALRQPVGMPGLAVACAGARTVAIVIDDQTRPTPTARVLPALLDELLLAGIPAESCTIVVGKGTHRWPSEAEVLAKVGPAAASCRVIVHDPDADDQLTYVGTTSRGTPVHVNKAVATADFVVGIGAVVTHYMAGYGGGPKLILPGVSGRQTIIANHVIARSDDAQQSRTAGNPLYQDMLEAAGLARLAMKIDVVLDMSNAPVGIVAGSVAQGHQAAILAYNRVFGFPVAQRADVTITTGYPLEIELLQSCKAVLSADLSTRDGGAIVLLSACVNGAGPGFGEALAKKPEVPTVWDWIACGKTTPTGGPMVARVLGVLQRKRVIVVTEGLPADEVRAMGFEHAPSPEAALELLERDYLVANVFVFPAGAAVNPIPAPVLV